MHLLKSSNMSVFSKIRWVASILLVFFIVLITNLIDKENFNKLNHSVTTIYEDRIVASDLLFELARLMRKKEVAIVSADKTFPENENTKLNQEVNKFIERYNQTKMTEKEKSVFNQLKDELAILIRVEQKNENSRREKALTSIEKINQHVYDLSKIQLQESRQQVYISNKAMNSIDLFTQFEIIFLIAMAILIQIIIFYKPKDLHEQVK